MRLRRLPDAEKVLRATYSLCESHYDLAQYYTLLATVLYRQGDPDKVDEISETFLNARAFTYSIPSAALHAELGLYEAHSAWWCRDLARAEQIAVDTLNVFPKPYDEPHSYPREVSNALLYELLSMIQSVREQYQTQATFIKLGLDELARLSTRHVWIEAGLLNNLSSLVPERRILDVARLMRTRAEALSWTPEVGEWAYNVHRALGWNEALDGNYIGAFKDMREAEALAPTPPWRLEAVLDRAYLFGQIGESTAARERLDEADRLFKTVDWSRVDEERYVLLWGAEIAARFDAVRAGALIAQYRLIRKAINPAIVGSVHCRRWQAYEHDAYGAVAAANGATSMALTHFRTALTSWDALSFEWRAAKTANAIARITNSTEDVVGARRRAEPFAKSWLARTCEVLLLAQ